MGNLADMLDGDDIDNRYAGKVFIYVESESDVRIFEKFIGPGYGERIEFKIPPEGGTGSGPAKARVARERVSNPKVFALLDGEAAVISDEGFESLLKCEKPVFANENADGLLFLAEHEAENILLRQANVCGYIRADTPLTRKSKWTEPEIIQSMDKITRIFFVAALCKYASAKLHAGNVMGGIIDTGIFRNTGKRFFIGKLLKKKVLAHNCNWDTYRAEVEALTDKVRAHFDGMDDERRTSERRRLADGKNVLSSLRVLFEVSPSWEGHLVEEVAKCAYAAHFREALFEVTNA